MNGYDQSCKGLKIIGKLQASARKLHVNLSEGSIPQGPGNDREAASLCKVSICKFIRGMHYFWVAASLCKEATYKFIRGMGLKKESLGGSFFVRCEFIRGMGQWLGDEHADHGGAH
jgi:hypothetical protein